jgi:hypothetical protein
VRILRGLDGKEDPSSRRSIRDAKRAPRDARSGFASFAGSSVRILKKLKGSGSQIETGAKAGRRDWQGCSSRYTGKNSRKYPACQLLYWYPFE